MYYEADINSANWMCHGPEGWVATQPLVGDANVRRASACRVVAIESLGFSCRVRFMRRRQAKARRTLAYLRCTKPRWRAVVAAWVRSVTPSLLRMLLI
jgi:hypothetical protein